VLQLASALTEKWRVAEVARRRVQDLETLVELSTDALQRSNARLADANEQLALQAERADKKAAAANPATCHRAISGKSSPLEVPTSQGGELRSETFSAKVKACAEHVAKAPPGG